MAPPDNQLIKKLFSEEEVIANMVFEELECREPFAIPLITFSHSLFQLVKSRGSLRENANFDDDFNIEIYQLWCLENKLDLKGNTTLKMASIIIAAYLDRFDKDPIFRYHLKNLYKPR